MWTIRIVSKSDKHNALFFLWKIWYTSDENECKPCRKGNKIYCLLSGVFSFAGIALSNLCCLFERTKQPVFFFDSEGSGSGCVLVTNEVAFHLYPVYTRKHTWSKHEANVFKIFVHDVCSKFASCLLCRVNTPYYSAWFLVPLQRLCRSAMLFSCNSDPPSRHEVWNHGGAGTERCGGCGRGGFAI